MLAIIDYKVGNIQSIVNAFNHITDKIILTNDEKIIKDADHIVLPGVGAFGKSMDNLEKSNLIPLILDQIKIGKPLLGICLGMQMLLSESEEMGFYKGLNAVPGKVIRFQDGKDKIPQIGWNNIEFKKPALFKGIKEGSMFYFVHSYYTIPNDFENVAGITEYNGIKYCSAIEKDNVFATQFHPEKSGEAGLKILQNFLNIK